MHSSPQHKIPFIAVTAVPNVIILVSLAVQYQQQVVRLLLLGP